MIYYILFFILLILLFFIIYSMNLVNIESNKKILTCYDKRFGCCNDNYTPKLDVFGSNCRGF